MSISKCTWALSVIAALSLGGCALEPYESEQDEGAVGVAAWDLSRVGDEETAGTEDGEDETVGLDDGTFDGEDGPEYLGDVQGEQESPFERIDSVAGPHPDPWDDLRTVKATGAGNSDD